jgi:hypothetical protein
MKTTDDDSRPEKTPHSFYTLLQFAFAADVVILVLVLFAVICTIL